MSSIWVTSSSQNTFHFNEDRAEWKAREGNTYWWKQQICGPLSGRAFECLWLLDSWLGRLSPATSFVPYAAHMWVEASVRASEPKLTRIIREPCLSPDPVPLASWFRESPFSAGAMANGEQLVLPLSPLPGRCHSCSIVYFPAEPRHKLKTPPHPAPRKLLLTGPPDFTTVMKKICLPWSMIRRS